MQRALSAKRGATPKGFETSAVFLPPSARAGEGVEGRLQRAEDGPERISAKRFAELEKRVNHLDAVLSEVLEASLGERILELEEMIKLGLQRIEEMDADRDVVMEYISQDRLQHIEQAARHAAPIHECERNGRPDRGAEGSAAASDTEAFLRGGGAARLRRELAEGQLELERRLSALQESLAEAGHVDAGLLELRVSRGRFQALCKSSGFKPQGRLAMLQGQAQAMGRVFAFGGQAMSLALRAASASFRREEAQSVGTVASQLRNLFARAAKGEEQLCPTELHAAIDVARSIGNLDQVRAGEELLRAKAAAELLSAMSGESTRPQDLATAIERAEVTGVDDADVRLARDHLAHRVETRDAAKRKLRVALAWTSSGNTEKLEQAVSEAERAGLEPRDLQNARAVLENFGRAPKGAEAPREHAGGESEFHDFLQSARPSWASTELQAVKAKLAKVGITTVEELGAALDAQGDKHLTERLRAANLKIFSAVTLTAFQDQLQRLDDECPD